MKLKIPFLSFLLWVVCPIVTAQTVIPDGYYRVHNLKTERYVYVYDNTGSINWSAADAEMGAIQLWKNHDRTLSDPGSVINLINKGSNDNGAIYDLRCQGTGIYDLIQHYINLFQTIDGYYQLCAATDGVTKYLSDGNTSLDMDKGGLSTDGSGAYRKWIATKIDVNTDEWFGITPSIVLNGHYYQPFFADFGFTPVSSGMKVWYISVVDSEGAVLKEFTGSVIPARMPVYIECASAKPSENKLDLKYNYTTVPEDNKLKGVYFNNSRRPLSKDARTEYDKSSMRVLGVMKDGRLGYILSKVTPDTNNKKQYLEANQSYLPVGAVFPEEIPVITESEYLIILDRRAEEQRIADSIRVADSIRIADSIAARIERVIPDNMAKSVYMLSGRSLGNLTREEIEQLPAGVYIIDRRKVVIDR